MAAPEAFGFLGAEPAGLVVDRGRLEVPAGEAFSMVGGDITVTADNNGLFSGGEDGTVRAEAGCGSRRAGMQESSTLSGRR